MPMELVTAGLEPALPAPLEVRVRGRLVQVAPAGPGSGTVVRLISSDPQDYLDPQFQPGASITWQATDADAAWQLANGTAQAALGLGPAAGVTRTAGPGT